MKATNKEPKNNVAQEKPVEQGESLLKMDALKPKFSHLTKEIDQFRKYADDVVVDSDTSLTVAENNIGLINDTLNNIDKVRKAIKDPYFQTTKTIDEYSKTLTIPLKEAKLVITGTVTSYKNIQTAQKAQEAKKILEQAETAADEQSKETDKIFRIETQLIARIYGGHWFNKLNQQKTSSGCVTVFEANNFRKTMKKKLPNPDTFIHKGMEYKKMIRDTEKKLTEHITSLIESEGESTVVKENAQKEINEAKETAIIDANTKKDTMTKDIVKEAKKEIKTSTDAIKEAGKGIKRQLKFEVVNIKEVPKEWLEINDSAVRAWANKNKGLIVKLIEDGDGITEGMKFTFEKTYVSR